MKLSMEKAQEMIREGNGCLDLVESEYTELPENLTVPLDLDIRYTKIPVLPKGLRVGRCLYANHSGLMFLPDGLMVREGLWLDYTRVMDLPKDMILGGTLTLTGCPIEHLPDNLTIPGSLCLNHSRVMALPKGLAVGVMLGLTDTSIRELPPDLKVGSWVSCMDDDGIGLNHKAGRFQKVEYVPGRYLFADHILTPVRKTKRLGDYLVYVGRFPGQYVLSDGTCFAHCGRIREGVEDIAFKKARRAETDTYRSLSLSDSLPTDEMVKMYRFITGACREGTNAFLERNKPLKSSYTVQEAIDLTRGCYGSGVFASYFAA